MTSGSGLGVPDLVEDPSSGLTYRLRPRSVPGSPSFLLLHGFGGDEDVLWVIQSALPEGGLVAAPRGLFPAEGGGFSWVDGNPGPGGSLHDFDPARQAISQWLTGLVRLHGLDLRDTYLLGFSQGSALAFALACLGDIEPGGLAALAAYLPEGDLGRLDGLPIFWSHGSRDDRVPVARARRDVERLRAAGARVDYCESDTGHKVGVECLRALKAWLHSG